MLDFSYMEKNEALYAIVGQLMQDGKGILAADESDATAGKRLEIAGLPNQAGNRQDFREIMFTAPGIEEYLSGVILYDSTIRENTDQGTPFVDVLGGRGIVPGIKVDMGTKGLAAFPNEVVSEGLDGLAERLKEYYLMGARFTKWRAVITISDETPTDEILRLNATQFALYALRVQEAGMVPIVEPEVMFPGKHTLERAEAVTTRTLQVLFETLKQYRVDLKGTILKSSMVLAGSEYQDPTNARDVAVSTIRTFQLGVPKEVGGIVFLSGGQSPKRATENLDAIARYGKQVWPITFSFSRALEEPVLLAWQGKPENIGDAQKALLTALKQNSLAQQGKLEPEKK
jgi:fructose-bisphosphate aldolase, class I